MSKLKELVLSMNVSVLILILTFFIKLNVDCSNLYGCDYDRGLPLKYYHKTGDVISDIPQINFFNLLLDFIIFVAIAFVIIEMIKKYKNK